MLSLRAHLVDTATPMPGGLRAVLAGHGVHTLRELLRTDIAAASVSWVGGGPPVTVLDDAGVQEKVTVVVLADGYSRGSQATFAQDAARVFVDGLFEIDFYRDNRHNFRVVRLGLVSADDTVSAPTVPRDTALGLVYDGNDFNDAGFTPYTPDTYERMAKALRVWRLDGDIVAVVAQTHDTTANWGKWGNRVMAVTANVAASLVAHELGHCFGLADEYVVDGQAMTYTGGEPSEPNVTVETRRDRTKWAALIAPGTPVPTAPTPPGWVSERDVGLFQGALRVFAAGVYRPSDGCKMNHDSVENPDKTRRPVPFCRVCADQVASALRYAIDHHGTPQGGGTPGASNSVAVTVRRQADGTIERLGALPTSVSSLVGPPRPGVEAHVATLGDRVVGAAAARTVGEHDFRSGDQGGAPVHRIPDDGSETFEVHLPASVDVGSVRFTRRTLTAGSAATTWAETTRRLS